MPNEQAMIEAVGLLRATQYYLHGTPGFCVDADALHHRIGEFLGRMPGEAHRVNERLERALWAELDVSWFLQVEQHGEAAARAPARVGSRAYPRA